MLAQLCLPSQTQELLAKVPIGSRHPGLQLDKLSPPGDQQRQKAALGEVIRTGGDEDLLRRLLARRREHLSTLGARTWQAETTGPLTLHLARASALENAGLCLHPLYGFAYLPGSGLKGMARGFAETVWLPAEADPVAAWQRIERVFGWTPESDKGKSYKPRGVPRHADDVRSRVGAVVFHDAWPETWPRLLVDITNNHHAQYYQGKDAPGDWENPNPVYFLAVASGTPFSFALAPRTPGPGAEELLDLAARWLQAALCQSGAGAKTAAGYGVFRLVGADQPPPVQSPALASCETTVQLVSPAFLAGAGQQDDDCDLRPASLRGLLRWWWRTLHAGFVDVKTLRALEAAVWGDTEAGGAVRLTVEPASPVAPVRLDGARLQQEHGLQKPPDRKTTQGLFYGYYGVDRTNRQSARYYIPPGAVWTVRLTARPAGYPNDAKGKNAATVPCDIVLDQAKAALWLLCRYGGVGSKSRKGFGSLSDVDGLTLEACKQAAAELRDCCGLTETKERDEETPAIGSLIGLEVDTPWKDPWFALDQLGYSAQGFAQRYKHKVEKIALGLPRKIHGPRENGPITRRDGTSVQDRWQPPEWLGKDHPKRDNKTKLENLRDAAPVHYHLAKAADGTLTIRVAAFPSPYLPDLATSRHVLAELLDHLCGDLRERIEEYRHTGRKEPPRSSTPVATATPPVAPQGPKRGDRIEAVLLPEKTSKGGWKARHEPTGRAGYIMNTADVPDEVEPGARVLLIVDIGKQHDFRLLWPTPKIEAEMQKSLAPRPPKKAGPRKR